MKIKPLTLIIEKEVWYEFKTIVPSSMTLNDAVVQLIESKIEEEKKEVM